MTSDESVTIHITAQPDIERNPEGTQYAARFRNLGLTAYGKDVETAQQALHELIDKCVRAYWSKGMLEEVLKQKNVRYEIVPTVSMPSAFAAGSGEILQRVAGNIEHWEEITGHATSERLSVVV